MSFLTSNLIVEISPKPANIYSKSTIKTPEQGVKYLISHLILLFLLLTLSSEMWAGNELGINA